MATPKTARPPGPGPADRDRARGRVPLRGLGRPAGIGPRLILAFTYVLLIGIVGFGVGHAAQLHTLARDDHLTERRDEAGLAASVAQEIVATRPGSVQKAELRDLAKRTLAVLQRGEHDAFARVLIVRADGAVVADEVASGAARGRGAARG